ncbi:trehalase family glycosidase [Bacteroidetes bacterium endosymbiont of Geopemphigus sp.]|uniref:trehalase family glycosidase n=1 Tax=Bacteroidetes bacterium endosymbiont of Geopemphigus sp. TaxID=2047937 RepID=UPI0011AED1D5
MRSACESGWDFSSQWLKDSGKLESIITMHLLPVELNCLLYRLEKTLCLSEG